MKEVIGSGRLNQLTTAMAMEGSVRIPCSRAGSDGVLVVGGFELKVRVISSYTITRKLEVP